MAIDITATPLSITLNPLGDWISTSIFSDPITISVYKKAVFSKWPANDRDTTLDQVFDCASEDRFGDSGVGIPETSISVIGNWLNVDIASSPITITVTHNSSGDWVESITVDSTAIDITLTPKSFGVLLELIKANWVKWSKVGAADFTIDHSNVAGEMPMDWPGYVWDVRKLMDKVVVYGSGGISVLSPVQNNFGLTTYNKVGIVSKNAVTGNDLKHYFINNMNELWEFSTELKKLGYSEFLENLSSPTMSFDESNGLIYICDGSYGYVYSIDTQSMAEGPANVSGYGYRNGTSYVSAPDAINIPLFEIKTDTYDFGTRKEKTIFGLEIGVNADSSLQATIEYRKNFKEDFKSIGWHNIGPDGRLKLPCYGVEFRFGIRGNTYSSFQLDSLRIDGVVHGYSYLDGMMGG